MVARSSEHPDVELSFQFSGDLADEGQLDFYEASRFLYGAARLVYTLEHFRRTGVVTERIGRRVDANFNIAAPQRGSWVADIVAASVPIVGDVGAVAPYLEVPLKSLAGWVWERLTGGRTNQIETVVKMEQLRLAQSKQATRQAELETRRAELQAMSANRFADMLEKELDRKEDYMTFLKEEVRDARAEAVAHRRLNSEIAPYEKELRKIKDKDAKQLIAKARPQITEMGLPLKGSASRLVVGGKSSDEKIIFVTRRTVDVLEGKTEDVKTTKVSADVIRFDKESGWGKFRVKAQPRQMSFFIPWEQRQELRDEVIDAMKQKVVEMVIRYVRDQQQNIKYAKVEEIYVE